MKKPVLTACLFALLAVPAGAEEKAAAGVTPPVAAVKTAQVPAGLYTLDKTHASLIFRIDHMGISRYTARFTRFDAELQIDPANPSAASITATIDPTSIQTNYPDPALDFDAELQKPSWLDAVQFPQMTFRSTGVQVTGADKARVTGELTLHGITQPVVLDVTFNGGYATQPMGPPAARIGFSARGALKRSDFGIKTGIPAPGSQMGVGDEVEFIIEAEFTKPISTQPQNKPAG